MTTTLAQAQVPQELTGIWQAKNRFGPDERGTIVIDRPGGVWRVSFAGRNSAPLVQRDSISFQIPGSGSFIGRVNAKRNAVVGHWMQSSWSASPLTLESCGTDCYRGEVVPINEAFTFFLKVSREPDGRLGAFLRNPERNLGCCWIRVRRLTVAGENVRWLDARDSLVLPGALRDGVMSVYIGNRGGSYDFRRVSDTAFTNFYPRGRPTVKYSYAPPRQEKDGWPVARLGDVGISEDSIAAFVQRLIDLPIDSVNAPQTHALLIARHGKLVLEEYFHGESADKPHDTRSASKTHVSALIGAAMLAGVRITPDTRVYATLRPRAANLPSRKQAMTLDHLLTMSAGFDCDDSGDRPGDEDAIQSQDSTPDWASLILNVDMVRDNGTTAVYCSMKPFLAGLMLERIAGRALPDLFHELLAGPLDFRQYSLGLTPLGEVYFGGGHRFVARDFLKLPQLYLSGGTWRGRRIVSKEWVDRSIAPRYQLGSRKYGYLWWIKDYSYRGRTIQAYMQLGNGSQNAIFIPELDLAIATFGGNYNSSSINYLLNVLIPTHILPAVEPGR